MRACFIAAPDCLLAGADYSQIELRVLAHLSQDRVFCEAFEKGDQASARAAFDQALQVDPANADARFLRARLDLSAGASQDIAMGVLAALALGKPHAAGDLIRRLTS